MTPEELAEALTQLIAGVEQTFTADVGRVQEALYRRLSGVLKDLSLDADGYILQNAENRAILRKSEGIFDEVIKGRAYQNAIEQSVSAVPDIDALNQSYFETISNTFKPNRVFIKSLQQQVINNINTYLLQDGLQANIKLPLNQVLNQNVNSGGSFSGMLDQLRKFVTGTVNEGRLMRYTRTYLTDTLFNYSRAYQEAVTADLSLEFYLYLGGLTKGGKGSEGSRPFCIERAGHYYHKKEIEAWASLEWKGKNPDTTESSIFVYAGGYNCKHSIIPVHVSVVPKEVIERAISEGYYRQAA
jgi:hypothetical protein